MSGVLLAEVANADGHIQTINQLIEAVRTSNCIYVRNGTEHSPKAAAAHLELKFTKAKKHVRNAEQFIDRIASKSSWTGNSYLMKCPGLPAQTSAKWLREKLDEIQL